MMRFKRFVVPALGLSLGASVGFFIDHFLVLEYYKESHGFMMHVLGVDWSTPHVLGGLFTIMSAVLGFSFANW